MEEELKTVVAEVGTSVAEKTEETKVSFVEEGTKAAEADASATAAAEEENRESAETTDVEALVAAAEERGYRRGRNEKIEELMRKPGAYDHQPQAQPADSQPSEILILNNPRVSIWDR